MSARHHRRPICVVAVLFALVSIPVAQASPGRTTPSIPSTDHRQTDASPPPQPLHRREALTIVAPGAPTGGWARTAEHVARALRSTGLVDEVTIVNREGDSGSFALAEFVDAYRGNGRALLVGGSVMLGVSPTGPVGANFRSLVPIARLTGESQALATSTASPIRSLDDLITTVRRAPDSLLWVGGSYGGSNHTAVTMIADAMRLDAIRAGFVPTDSRGDMLAFVTSHPMAIGLGGFGEFAPDVAAGRLRVLGLTAAAREPGIDVPALREKGVDVVFVNWRGLFAAPGTTAAEQERLAAVVAEMVRRPEWRAVLAEQYWEDLYQGPDEFSRFLDAVLQSSPAPGPVAAAVAGTRGWASVPAWLTATLVLLVMGGVGGGLLWWRQRRDARVREQALATNLEEARLEAERLARTADTLVKGIGDKLDSQFEAWSLTPAEKEVASLLLKGMRHKEIADLRHTSERTVRQQALAVYRKAGVEGRTELAAYFLEDLMPSPDEPAPSQRSA